MFTVSPLEYNVFVAILEMSMSLPLLEGTKINIIRSDTTGYYYKVCILNAEMLYVTYICTYTYVYFVLPISTGSVPYNE